MKNEQVARIDYSALTYKEVQQLYVQKVGGSAIGKKRVDLEEAIEQVEENEIAVLVEASDEEIKEAASNVSADMPAEESEQERLVYGQKKGYAHSTREADYMSLSARIRHMFFVEQKKQAEIAKTLQIVPQMVSNVVRNHKQKMAEEGFSYTGE